MTEELLNDLRVASTWLSRPIDGKLVHMLAEEVVRLRDIVNDRQSEVNRFKPGLESEVVRLTQAIEPLRNELARTEKQLRNELAVMEKRYQDAVEEIETEECRFDKLLPLLLLCADMSVEPQAAQIIREVLTPDVLDKLDICLPTQASRDVGEDWIQITASRMCRLEKNIPHSLHYAIDGVYLKRNSDGRDFAIRLLDGRNFVHQSVWKVVNILPPC
jgi:hypothetical protein